MTEKVIKTENGKCESCGGTYIYSPETKSLKCSSCGKTKEIENSTNFQKHDYSEDAENTEQYREWREANKIFKCSECGANVILGGLDISKVCPYCGNTLAMNENDIAGLVPDAIIPFKFSNEKASVLYKQGVKKKWFLPNKFKKAPPVDEIKGIYIPSFSFDQDSNSTYSARLGTTHTDSDGHSHTTYRNVSGKKNMQHKDFLIETSSFIQQIVFEQLKPFNTSERVDFKNEFILGYSVENYDQALKNCKNIADTMLKEVIKNAILSQYTYDTIASYSQNTIFSNEKYLYNLLPTYRVNYLYKQKQYTAFMNGQTGKVGGKFPRSAVKITLLVLLILIIVSGIATLFYLGANSQ